MPHAELQVAELLCSEASRNGTPEPLGLMFVDPDEDLILVENRAYLVPDHGCVADLGKVAVGQSWALARSQAFPFLQDVAADEPHQVEIAHCVRVFQFYGLCWGYSLAVMLVNGGR